MDRIDPRKRQAVFGVDDEEAIENTHSGVDNFSPHPIGLLRFTVETISAVHTFSAALESGRD